MKLLKEELSQEDIDQIIQRDKRKIKYIEESLTTVIDMFDQIQNDFQKLGIHSADIDRYITNDLENIADIEDTYSYNLNLAQLLERLEDFESERRQI